MKWLGLRHKIKSRVSKVRNSSRLLGIIAILLFFFTNCTPSGFEVLSTQIENPQGTDSGGDSTTTPTTPSEPGGPSTPTPSEPGPGNPNPPTEPVDPATPTPNPTPPKVALISCGQAQFEFPLSSHWSNTAMDVVEGATDDLNTAEPDAVGTRRMYNYGFVPQFNKYIGMDYDLRRLPDNKFRNFANTRCANEGVAIELRRPSSFSNWAVARNKVVEKRGSIQVLYAMRVNGALVNIILPPNWSKQDSRGTYPVLVGGAYDLESGFEWDAGAIISTMAKTWKDSETPFIGIHWNGGGGMVSRTMNSWSRQQFNDIIQKLAENFGADPYRIVSVGTSRGGAATLNVSSNPELYPYRVVAAFAAVPPTDLNLLTEITGTTVPLLLSAAEWSIGLLDTWKKDFRYPSLGNAMTGFTRTEAHKHILVGSRSSTELQNNLNLNSPRMLNALKRSGTQVYLAIASHDGIVGWVDQYKYSRALRQFGIPMELSVHYLSGHSGTPAKMNVQNYARVMTQVSKRIFTNLVSAGAASYVRNDYLRKAEVLTSTQSQAFTFEIPRAVSPSLQGHIIMTGIPGTKVEVDGTHRLQGENVERAFAKQQWTLDSSGVMIAPFNYATGVYWLRAIRIQKPGQSAWTNIDLNYATTSWMRGVLQVDVLPEDPNGDLSAATLSYQIMEQYLGVGITHKVNGHDVVSYGVAEAN